MNSPHVPASSPATEAVTGGHSEAHVSLRNVSVRYGVGENAVVALDNANLDIRRGEFLALVGASGCGKSTILRLVSDLVRPTEGSVRVGSQGEAVRIGMAFQNATMLPWLTILQNVMLPLKIVEPMRHEYSAKRRGEFLDRAEDLLEQVGLKDFGDKSPWQLSGGMLQRASLCRALIHNPSLLLLDEPFAALDQFTREELWENLQQLWMTYRPTIVMVTHDFREAVFLATRMCVLRARPGRVIEDMAVPFPMPRTLEMTYDPEFVSLMHQARNHIDGTRAKAERAS